VYPLSTISEGTAGNVRKQQLQASFRAVGFKGSTINEKHLQENNA